MSRKVYNWKRFWCPREGKLNLTDDGYLWDPDSEFGSIYNPDVVPFGSISNLPCLALLGEPGMGKSTAMQSQKESIDKEVTERGDASLWIDLRAYQSDARLTEALFGSPAFKSWVNGNYRLHLFLDSLDECLLRIDTIASLLIEEFRNYLVDRLYLRIACRTADWPNSLEDGLRQIWGGEVVKVYELAPLRRLDVFEAAKSGGLDPESFCSEIDNKGVIPLAIKPITLHFLLNTYMRAGQFPSSQAELYLKGCHLLCEETGESRQASQRTGALTAEQRFAIAARVAALTIFTNRYAIWMTYDAGDVPEEDIKISDLCGGKESIGSDEIGVGEAAVKETLSTGLFSARGPNRMGWAHQTYAEFLAARYLVRRKMTTAQIGSLIVHPEDADRKLVPQLHETAAWLAGMLPEVFRVIMKTDPEVLLRSDVATADAADRAALVETVLKLYDEEKLLDRDFGIRRRYDKLAHSNLAEQLEPFIRDRTKGIIVRRVAVDIAEACELQSLLTVLADLALDPGESLPERVTAAYAVTRIGDDATRARLKPLATGGAGDDPDDELKGCGLRAVWPSGMTPKELFSILTPPRQSSLVGAYHMFIVSDLPKSLQPSHLPEALLWIRMQGSRYTMDYAFRKLADVIVVMGWEHLDFPGVLEAFAKAALSRIRYHEGLVEDRHDHSLDAQLREDHSKRRRLLESMAIIAADSEEDSTDIAYSPSPIALSQDLPWMIELLRSSKTEKEKRMWSRIISRSFDRSDPRQVDAILVACDIEPTLAEEFQWLIKPVELGSPQAEKMKADYLKWEEWDRKNRERPLLDPPPEKRIEKLLDEYESGVHSAWWRLNREMTLKPDSTHYDPYKEFESDLTTLPGWEAASGVSKQRILEAAKSYLFKQDPETQQWLGKNTLYRPAYAAYRAFLLLLREDQSFVSNLPGAVWKQWAPIILAYPTPDGGDEARPHHELVKLAYSFAPEEIIQTLTILIDKDNNDLGHGSITRKIESCWDKRLADTLLEKVTDTRLKPESTRVLLEALIDHDVQEAASLARSLISLPLPAVENERSRIVLAAGVLIMHAKDAGWSTVWPAMQRDPEFAKEVVAIVAGREGWGGGKGIWQKLNEEQLADLFIWLVQQYPYSEDPEREGGLVTIAESIAHWRDAILQGLKLKGTPQACDEIKRISQRFPELTWLKWTLMEAQANARRHTWEPPKPSHILTLSTSPDVRLVQNGDHLLDVIIDSLRRLESKLQGETPAAQFLWDNSQNAFRPKEEGLFCDFVKIHLDDDLRKRGIIVNREVQIHGGERTDIHIRAVVVGREEDLYDSVTVIIEAKGCWNPELKHAMETQLLGRYLKNNPCLHGVYLVGWFNCELWDNKDRRKKRAPKLTVDEAQREFDAQALELSTRGKLLKAFVINTALR